LPYGLSKKHLEDKKDELETALQARIELTSNKDYTVDLHVIEREFFDENDKQAFLEAIQESKEMEFIIGTLQTGEILKCDFGANFFSTLVCGASGSGKSVWLKCYLLQACIKQMELVIVDLKGVDFHVFKRYKHLRQYATTAEEAEEVLQMVYELMITRYEQLKVAECSSYAEYNQQTESPMNPLILLIDEFSVLIDSKPAKAALFDLLSRCRACNINVILATQSPRANVIEGVLRCNIKQSIVFRCESETDSEVALGEKGNYMAFDKLPVCGRGLFKSGSHLSIFQGFYFTDNNLKKMIE
jgi:S-DNA-T family DNA segregation ATPase FtsK/SpoIIIE